MEQGIERELEQAAAIYQQLVSFFVDYSFQLIGAIFIMLIGLYIGRKFGAVVFALCERKNIDVTLSRFIASFVRIATIVMVAIIALNKLGVSVTPFLAAIGALSLGAGLAMQGLLSNYGAGLNIVLTRPFVVGDTISVQGVSGVVTEVHLAYTLLSNEDEVAILIPNKHIVGEIIHNSQADTVIELSVGIAYDGDVHQAIGCIKSSLQGIEGISTAREAQIGIDTFGDSAIILGVRVWAQTQRHFQIRYQANAAIFKALQTAKITIPFPQHDVHIHSQSEI